MWKPPATASSTEARRCDGAITGDEGVAGRTKDRADVAALSEHLGLKDLVSLHRNARFLASGPGEGFRGRSPWHARRVFRPTTMPCGQNENSHTGSGPGIHPSFGFLTEPETNGVVERWNRTLKEQAIYGRVFENLADVRAAVAEFVERYNQRWRLEKLAYQTPLEAREEYELRHAA